MNKFRNVKTTTADGITHDSKKEAARWCDLLMLQRGGEITGLERQFVVPLMGQDGPLLSRAGRKLKYIADFRYFDNRLNAWVIEDAKGVETEGFKLKRAICAAMGIDVTTI